MVEAVTVPVALIQESAGDAFKALLNYRIPVILQLSWVDVEPHTAQKARAGSPSLAPAAPAARGAGRARGGDALTPRRGPPLQWRRQKQVEWEFWSNSNDECGYKCDRQRKFISDFAARCPSPPPPVPSYPLLLPESPSFPC